MLLMISVKMHSDGRGESQNKRGEERLSRMAADSANKRMFLQSAHKLEANAGLMR